MQPPSVDRLSPELSSAAVRIAEVFRQAGKQAWIVGGAVRDLALGLRPKDLDVVTDARPEEIGLLFPGARAVGRAFGVMLVEVQGQVIEVATFRSDGRYTDGRHPTKVIFCTSAEEGVLRRDFTCNAIYLCPLSGDVLDPLGGLKDLAAGQLKAVGDPRDRFSEDGLRLVRAARFCAQYDLEPAPGLPEAARHSLKSLTGVSAERREGELQRILGGRAPGQALRILDSMGVTAEFFPWLTAPHDQAAVAVLEQLKPQSLPLAGWATLLLCPAPKTSAELEARMHAFRLPGKRRQALGFLATVGPKLGDLWQADRADRILALRGGPWEVAMDWAKAQAKVRGAAEFSAQLEDFHAWMASLSPQEVHPEREVAAAELERLGLAPGPLTGRVLDAALRSQMNGNLPDPAAREAWLRDLITRAQAGD